MVKLVKGNSFSLLLETRKITFLNQEPFNLETVKNLTVKFVNYPYLVTVTPRVVGSIMRLDSDGNLLLGTYDLEITCQDEYGVNMRYYGESIFQIVNGTREGDSSNNSILDPTAYNLGVIGIRFGGDCSCGSGGSGGGDGSGSGTLEAISSHRVRVYTKSSETPNTPSNNYGHWDFENKVFSDCPAGWYETSQEAINNGEGNYVWFSDRFFKSDGNHEDWSEPLMMITPDLILNPEVPAYGSTVAYKASKDRPDTPTGGTYDFEKKVLTVPPTGWFSTPEAASTDETKSLWYSVGTFVEGGDIIWTIPLPYITKDDIITGSSSHTKIYGVSAFICTKADATNPDTPTSDKAVFDFTLGALTVPPEGWSLTPENAKSYYNTNINPEDNSPKIWVSFNNFSAEYPGGVIDPDTISETGWTRPLPYLDIEGILDAAKLDSEEIAAGVLSQAQGDIENLRSEYLQAIDDKLSGVSSTIDSLKVLYSWELWTGDTPADEHILTDATSLADLNNRYTGSLYFNCTTTITEGGVLRTYKYIASSAELTTKLESLTLTVNEQGEIINKYEEAKIDLLPGEIELLAGRVTEAEDKSLEALAAVVDITPEGIREQVTEAIKGSDSQEIIKSSAINVVKDSISLAVVDNIGDDGNSTGHKSTIVLTSEGVAIDSSRITLTGDVLASAITAGDLNINNTTKLNGDGDATFAQGNGKLSSAIWANGSGYLAGEYIKWGPIINNEITLNLNLESELKELENPPIWGLSVTGHIEAESGSFGPWTIGWAEDDSNHNSPMLLGLGDNLERVSLSPSEFLSVTTDGRINWNIKGDGTLNFGNSTVTGKWDKNRYIFTVMGNIQAYAGEIGDIGSDYSWKIGTIILRNSEGDIVNRIGALVSGSCSQKTNDQGDYIEINSSSPYLILSTDYLACGLNETPKWILRKDGSGFFAGGNISWHTNGNASFEGEITATSGNIGGWNISESGLCGGNTHIHPEGNIFAQSSTSHTENNPYWILRGNGSGSLAQGKIFWKSNGETTIGGWTIGEKKITGGGENNTLTMSPEDGVSLQNNGNDIWALKEDGMATFASGALKCYSNGEVIIDLSGSFTEGTTTTSTATYIDGRGLAFYLGANASSENAIPEYSIGVDGVLKKLSDEDGYAQGLFYRIVKSEDAAKSASKSNPGVLYAIPEEGETIAPGTIPGYSSSNRTGRR